MSVSVQLPGQTNRWCYMEARSTAMPHHAAAMPSATESNIDTLAKVKTPRETNAHRHINSQYTASSQHMHGRVSFLLLSLAFVFSSFLSAFS